MSECSLHLLPERRTVERFRRRRLCTLHVDGRTISARLRAVSATGAFLETNIRPPLDAEIRLMHPDAGDIVGQVARVAADGIGVRLAGDLAAMTFALVAISADMTVSSSAAIRPANTRNSH